jgi:hypothetical protein
VPIWPNWEGRLAQRRRICTHAPTSTLAKTSHIGAQLRTAPHETNQKQRSKEQINNNTNNNDNNNSNNNSDNNKAPQWERNNNNRTLADLVAVHAPVSRWLVANLKVSGGQSWHVDNEVEPPLMYFFPAAHVGCTAQEGWLLREEYLPANVFVFFNLKKKKVT